MRLVILGAGGHARVVAEAALASGHVIAGFLDADPDRRGTSVLGLPVLGDDSVLHALDPAVTSVASGLGSGSGWGRRTIVLCGVDALEFAAPVIVDPSASVSGTAVLDRGVQVLAGARVQTGAGVGEWTVVNTGAIVEHDCRLGSFVHIAPGAILCGQVVVGTGAVIGAGAIVREGTTIGEGAVVGAGAVVLNDVDPGRTVVGNPARVLR